MGNWSPRVFTWGFLPPPSPPPSPPAPGAIKTYQLYGISQIIYEHKITARHIRIILKASFMEHMMFCFEQCHCYYCTHLIDDVDRRTKVDHGNINIL